MKLINKIIYFVTLIVSLLLGYYITKLNVLPTKYYFLFMIILVGWMVLLGLFAVKSNNKFLQIFIFILIVCTLVLNGIGTYYIYNTNQFFVKLKDVNETKVYYVVVKKNSNYKRLTDLDGKKIGLFDSEVKNYKKAIKKLDSKVKINHKDYEGIDSLVEDLLGDSVDSALLNSSVYDIIDENIDNFSDDTRIIEKVTIGIPKATNKKRDNNDSFNILISGIDVAGDINTVSRSDVNIVVTVNRKTHEFVLTSVPRDMQVQLHGTTGLKDKLTHAGIYGIDMSRQTIEDFLEIDIDYYIRANFTSVINIVDAIDGIDVNNDIAFQGKTRYFDQGKIHLNGKQTLEYCRERYKMPSGDWNRGLHQEEVIKAILTKVTSSEELLTNYAEFISSLDSFIQTNIPNSLLKKYVKDQLDDMNSWEINYYAVGGSGSDITETYSMPGMNLYVTLPDEGHRKHASKVINSVLSGKRYKDIDW